MLRLLLIATLASVVLSLSSTEQPPQQYHDGQERGGKWQPPPPHGPVDKGAPNIVFSLTDDQDIELGGWTPMVQTHALLQKNGALLTSWRIHTPICSPSRSETVSGRYFHNIKSNAAVPPPHLMPAASAHVNSSYYKNQSFGVYLRAQKGYNVAMFGKSNFNTMEGFDRWFQGAFLGYGGYWQDNESPNFAYKASKTDYATALLGNKSTEWLERDNVTGASSGGRPFFLYLRIPVVHSLSKLSCSLLQQTRYFAPHCPHTPATPADWYNETCAGVKSPRNPAYNWSGVAGDFHELVRRRIPAVNS